MCKPYETEREAVAGAHHILGPDTALDTQGNRQILESACTAARIQLGAWDHRILLWLAQWESSTCAMIGGLITRAHAGALSPAQLGTVLAALEDAATLHEERAAVHCAACSEHPAWL